MSTSGGKAVYFEAAQAILAAEGADGLTQAAICERLHVTTGAFYYHFGSMGAFVASFAASRKAHYGAVFDDLIRERDPIRRLELLADIYFAMSHRAEAAFRAWGATNEVVQETVSTLDARVEKAMAEALTELLGDPVRAALLADMALSLAIGVQARRLPVDVQRLIDIHIEWYRSMFGFEIEIVFVDGVPGIRLRVPQVQRKL